ncbi:MAG: hypothetical protein O3B41_06700 [Bacteroidetes bacterium]|nr:hypothetical protein [Bacteroidota bacterium]
MSTTSISTQLDTRSPLPERLLEAKTGCESARSDLSTWVYSEALRYFTSQVSREPLFSLFDAQDLAGESLLEFQRAIPRIQTLPRYVRRMLRNNLIRHLSRKRARRTREFLGGDLSIADEFAEYVGEQPVETSELNDFDHRRLTTSLRKLEAADNTLRKIWSFRLADEPLPYREIGAILGMEDAALRMRIARFCRSVRDECKRNERRLRIDALASKAS